MNSFLDSLIEKIKKIKILRSLFNLPFINKTYHFILSFLGALIYQFPSKKIYTIGVTGTKGKSSVSYLIYQILNLAGFKCGLISTPLIGDGDKIWQNKTKQTMLGRFAIQELLKKFIKNNCKYVVVETSSEGILQYRHSFINYKVGVFTNLSPEHIERHGSFFNYRRTKIKLFEKIAKEKDGIGIYNLDDENVEYFLEPDIPNKYGFAIKKESDDDINYLVSKLIKAEKIKCYSNKTTFEIRGKKFETQLIGEFNVYNILAAITTALSIGISSEVIQKILPQIEPPPGRLEFVPNNLNIKIVVDYAHEPKSLESVYSSLKLFNPKNIICLLGGQGGGRDKWKRKEMGKIAALFCDYIFLTNEDPYDEDPENILLDIEKGIEEIDTKNKKVKKVFKIIDRKEALKQAILLAKPNDVVISTGKGGEVWMCVENNKKIPWEESKIIKEILEEIKK
jgi:UDP-N-acetylmuramoyl-L-alanyl-D-glutamate--2,6-diaminopimelate ligase